MRPFIVAAVLICLVYTIHAKSDIQISGDDEESAYGLLPNDGALVESGRPSTLHYICITLMFVSTVIVMKPQTQMLTFLVNEFAITPYWLGFILAVFPLATTIASPFFGKWLFRIGITNMIVLGALCCALSAIGLSPLDLVAKAGGPIAVIAVALAVRVFAGTSQAAASTASVAYINFVYKDHYATATAICNSLGASLGLAIPLLSTLLFNSGGFAMPFLTFGAIAIVMIIASSPFLPKDLISTPVADAPPISFGAMRRMPRLSITLMVLFSNMASSGLIGAVAPLILENSDLSDMIVSWFFSLSSVCWMAGSLLGGFFVERTHPDATMHISNAMGIAALAGVTFFHGGFLSFISFLVLSLATAAAQTASCFILVQDARRIGDVAIPFTTGMKIAGKSFGEAFGNLVGTLLFTYGGKSLVGVTFGLLSVVTAIVYQASIMVLDSAPPPVNLHEPLLENYAPAGNRFFKLVSKITSLGKIKNWGLRTLYRNNSD